MSEFHPLPPELDRTEIDPGELDLSDEFLLACYRIMRLTRTFEDRLATLYKQGRTFGAVYLGTGQEAIATGVASVMNPGDIFNTVSRSLAAWFYRGVQPRDVLARWLGKDIPPSHGRELGLFLADLERYGIAPYHNGSMASWIPTGAGFALGMKMRRLGNVYIAFTGDGATSPGDFYEGLNFAAIHKLPLVVVVENNQFAYSTPIEKQMPVRWVSDRAPAFNIYRDLAFGNDLFGVIVAAGRAIQHARAGKGPALVEFATFRRRGHGEHDDASYVPEAMRSYWEQRDPMTLLTTYLRNRRRIPTESLDYHDQDATRIVDEAVRYAESLPYPPAESVTERLYAPRGTAVPASER